MSKNGDANAGIQQISVIWFNYYEELYEEKWSKAMQLLTKKAGLKDLDEDCEYFAGLLWIELYDLAGAVGSKAIKSTELVEGFMLALANKYDVEKADLWKIFSNMSGVVLPHGIYLDVYCLLDEDYSPKPIKNGDAIKGFDVFSRKIMDTSNLGYFFNHIGEFKG